MKRSNPGVQTTKSFIFTQWITCSGFEGGEFYDDNPQEAETAMLLAQAAIGLAEKKLGE